MHASLCYCYQRADREQSSTVTCNTRSDTSKPYSDQLSMLIGVLQAPRVTIPMFDGNPMSYAHIFIRAFEDNVERVIADDASRLARLAHQCTGEAARVIDCCMIVTSQGVPPG